MTETSSHEPRVVPVGLTVDGPHVVGATGGSGTRVVAKILRAGGMFTGDKLNPYEDAVELGFYSDRWIDSYVEAEGEPAEGVRREMADDLHAVLADHLSGLPGDAVAWGWKEPRSIYLLRFWNEVMPSVRFLHFVRDGRDLAFSENQNQLKTHGKAVLGEDFRKAKTPIRSIALWNRVNAAAADYGEQELGPRYLRVRFEDLCAEPGPTVTRIYDFFGLEGDAPAIGEATVRPPETLGRWRSHKLAGELTRTAEATLGRFGYL